MPCDPSRLRRRQLPLLALLAAPAAARALPFRDAEAAVAEAYANYRVALFATNQRDQAAAEQALARFSARWARLAAAWRDAPPPQYAEDPALGATLEAVAAIAARAAEETRRGALAEAHETLEAIRDALGELRARNGVAVFSDRMNAYHAQMEAVLEIAPDAPDALARLRAATAVLAHLAASLSAHPPQAADAGFAPALAAVLASVAALEAAAAAGDAEAIRAALARLKPAYARLFLRYG